MSETPPRIVVSAVPGRATFYTPPYAPSSCYGYEEKGTMIAAAIDAIWDNKAACGRRYFVRCTGPTNQGVPQLCRGNGVTVTIVDYCPTGCRRTIDLSQEAFAIIAYPNAGNVNIDYYHTTPKMKVLTAVKIILLLSTNVNGLMTSIRGPSIIASTTHSSHSRLFTTLLLSSSRDISLLSLDIYFRICSVIHYIIFFQIYRSNNRANPKLLLERIYPCEGIRLKKSHTSSSDG